MFDRRKFKRYRPNIREPIEVQIMGPGFLDVVKAVDISLNGVGIYLPHGLPLEALNVDVEIIVTPTGDRPFHCHGIIRHQKSRGDRNRFGIEFLNLSDKANGILERCIERLKSRQSQL